MNGRMAAAVFAVAALGGVLVPARQVEAGTYVHIGFGVRHHAVYVALPPVIVSQPVYVAPIPVVVTRRVYVAAPPPVVVVPRYPYAIYHYPRHVAYHHGHHGFGFHFSFGHHHH